IGILFSTTLADDLSVLSTQPGEPANHEMMSRYLSGLATAALDRREKQTETIKSAEQNAAYPARMKEFLVRELGGFPERTPLNARVVGTLDKGDYRVEKVLFESRPGFHVTGLLFLPKGSGPFAACIVPCGHSANGKEQDTYQLASILLATNGIA